MTLGDFLTQTGLSQIEFARRIGVNQQSVNRYVRGARVPNAAISLRIMAETHGRVTPTDFVVVANEAKLAFAAGRKRRSRATKAVDAALGHSRT